MNDEDIFLAAVEKAPAERAAFLDAACGHDAGLLARVKALLRSHEEAGSLLEQPLFRPAPTVDLPPEAEQVGAVIGPYKLLQQIGEGGMGTVFMAEQTEPIQRKVALKVIKPGMDSRQVIARFEAERQALALMDHVNIARVFDGGTTENGRPYFVMELVHGVPITKYCDDHHLTPRERLELFVPVCRAIQHAHQKGIIHRDIKPSNVMVTLYDGKPVPKVIDFGVAKATEQKLTERTLFTQYGTMVGTPEYMSPEQAEMSALGVDTRSDIYSLGVLLYELLTGSTPLTHKRLKNAAYGEILRMIKEEEPQKPSTRLSDSGEALASISAQRKTEPAKLAKLLRGELDWIVMKTLEKDRNRRYETANGFAADVQRYLAGEAVQAVPPSAGYRLRKFARRNKAGVAVAALILGLLMLLGGGAGWAARDRAARHAKVAGQVESILAEEHELEGAQKWPEALAAARRAEAVAAGGEIDARTADSVRERLAELQFIDRLDQARMRMATTVDGQFDDSGADREYARAFREYGVDVDALSVETSIHRLSVRPALAIPLAAALDEWGLRRGVVAKKGVAPGKRLVDIARGIDPDPLRGRLRAVWVRRALDVRDEVRRIAESIDVRAHRPATLVCLSRTLMKIKDFELATRLLREARHVHPGDFWLNFDLGLVLHEQKDLDEAIRFYTAAVSIRPGSAAAHRNLGFQLRLRNRLDEALTCFLRGNELDPASARGYRELGRVLAGQGKADEAIEAFRKAIELDPRDPYGPSDLGSAAWELANRPEPKRRDCGRAVELLNELLAVHPQSAEAWRRLGWVQYRNGKWRASIEALEKSCRLQQGGTGDSYQWIVLALAHWKLSAETGLADQERSRHRAEARRRYEQADQQMNGWWSNRPADPDGRSGWDFLEEAREVMSPLAGLTDDQIVARATQALKDEPPSANWHRDRALAYARLGRPDDAAADFAAAIELSRGRPPADPFLDPVYQALAPLDDVAARVARLRPQDTGLWVQRGRYFARRRQWARAAEAYSRAGADRLPLGDAAWEYACLLVLTGDRDSYRRLCARLAERFGQQGAGPWLAVACQAGPASGTDPAKLAAWARPADPDRANAWELHHYALALHRAGRDDEALACLEQANAKEGTSLIHNAFVFALIHHGLGNRGGSRWYYQQALNGFREELSKDLGIATPHWIYAHVLEQEATRVLKSGESAPPDKAGPAK